MLTSLQIFAVMMMTVKKNIEWGNDVEFDFGDEDIDGDTDEDESDIDDDERVGTHINKTSGKANSSSSRKPDGSLKERKNYLLGGLFEGYVPFCPIYHVTQVLKWLT